MPRKGYTTITVRKEIYEMFRQEYVKRRSEYIKRGITTFQGFVTALLNESIEREKERNRALTSQV